MRGVHERDTSFSGHLTLAGVSDTVVKHVDEVDEHSQARRRVLNDEVVVAVQNPAKRKSMGITEAVKTSVNSCLAAKLVGVESGRVGVKGTACEARANRQGSSGLINDILIGIRA